jgi:hypothetical protein
MSECHGIGIGKDFMEDDFIMTEHMGKGEITQ